MPDSPLSLLDRLRLRPDGASWKRFADLYTPLIRRWLQHCSLQEIDTDDLMQEILDMVLRDLRDYRPDRQPGAFRRWLRTLVVHRFRSYWRDRRNPLSGAAWEVEDTLIQLEDPGSDLCRWWDDEHDPHVVHRLFQLMQPEFEPAAWRAFQQQYLENGPALEPGIPAATGHAQILERFQQEVRGLID